MSDIVLHLDEVERQVLLVALAQLSLKRQGWESILEKIAQKVDPSCQMYYRLRLTLLGIWPF